jgi:hypothetical protein
MLSIKFHFPEEEDIHEYSLGHMDIFAEENLLSSKWQISTIDDGFCIYC